MRVRKNWFFLTFTHYVMFILILLLNEFNLISKEVCGLFGIIITIPIIIKTIKENKLFSPISANIIFDVSFSLYLMGLVTTYKVAKIDFFFPIITCSFIWKSIVVAGKGFECNVKVNEIKSQQIDRGRFTLYMTVLFIIAVACMLFEWRMAGGIPALKDDSEVFRFAVSYSPYTHIFAMMNKIVAALIGVYLVNKGKISFKRDFLLILEMVISELLMIGTSFRGEIILAPCIIFIVYAIKKKLPLKVYIIGGILALAFVGFLPFFRMLQINGVSYINSMKTISKYPEYFFITPLYETFTTNFEVLFWDYSIFPKMRDFGFGIYSILPMIPFVDLGASLANVQNEVFNKGFYSALTATYLAPWYADFNWIGCFVITALYAKLVTYAYNHYLRKRTLFSLVWYAYTFYTSLWVTYSGIFNFVYLCYSVLMWMVFNTRIHQREK